MGIIEDNKKKKEGGDSTTPLFSFTSDIADKSKKEKEEYNKKVDAMLEDSGFEYNKKKRISDYKQGSKDLRAEAKKVSKEMPLEEKSVFNTGEMGFGQTFGSIKNDWKNYFSSAKDSFAKVKEKEAPKTLGEGLNMGFSDFITVMGVALKGGGTLALTPLKLAAGVYDDAFTSDDKDIASKLKELNDEKFDTKKIAKERLNESMTSVEKVYDEYEKTGSDILDAGNKLEYLRAKLKEMDDTPKEDRLKVPEWNANYLATKKALQSSKIDFDTKTALFEAKMEEARKKQEEHRESEYALTPYSEHLYKDEKGANNYRNIVQERVFRDEDGKLFGISSNEETLERDSDIRNILKGAERNIFESVDGVKDAADLVNRGDIRDSEEFLEKVANVLTGMKTRLIESGDSLYEEEVNAYGEKTKVIDKKFVADLLKEHSDALDSLSDDIIDANLGTKLDNITNEESYKYTNKNYMKKGWEFLTRSWDVLEAATDSKSSRAKLDNKWQLFSHDRSNLWIDKATDNSNILDSIWDAAASNPVRAVYFVGSLLLPRTKTKMVGKGRKLVSLTEGMEGVGYVTKNFRLNKIINSVARKGVGVIDEMLLSLPLDLILSDGDDLMTNSFFNTLGGVWKIGSAPEFNNILTQIGKFNTAPARKAFFMERIGVEGLANKIDFTKGGLEIQNQVSSAVRNYGNSVLGSDKGLAALHMINSINAGIDNISFDKLDAIEEMTKAIGDSFDIAQTPTKGKGKDISSIIAKGKAEAGAAKTNIAKLEIENKTVEAVKDQFRSFLDNFNVDRLNDIYNTKLVSGKTSAAFSNIIEEGSKYTGIDSFDFGTIILHSILGKTNSSDLLGVIKDRLVKGIAGGNLGMTYSPKTTLKRVSSALGGELGDMITSVDNVASNAIENIDNVKAVVSKKNKEFLKGQKKIADSLAVEQGGDIVADIADISKVEKQGKDIIISASKEVANDPELVKLVKNAEQNLLKESADIYDDGDVMLSGKQRIDIIKDFLKNKYKFTDDTPGLNQFATFVNNHIVNPSVMDNEGVWGVGKIVDEGILDNIIPSVKNVGVKETNEKLIKATLSKEAKKDKEFVDGVVNGIDSLVQFTNDNKAVVKKSGLIDGLEAVASKLDGDTAKVSLTSMVGNYIDSWVNAFAKGKGYKGVELGSRELATLIANNWNQGEKDIIYKLMKDYFVSEANTVDFNALTNFIGTKVMKGDTKKLYTNLVKEGNLDKIFERALIDKVGSDIVLAGNDFRWFVKMMTENVSSDPALAALNRGVGNLSVAGGRVIINANAAIAMKMGELPDHVGEVIHMTEASTKAQKTLTKGTTKADKVDSIISAEALTNKQKTLLRMGIDDETIGIATMLKSNTVPEISPEFLNRDGWSMMMRMLGADKGLMSEKQIELLAKGFAESKSKLKKGMFSSLFGIKNYLFNREIGRLSTNAKGFSLNAILKGLPARVSDGALNSNIGGILFEPRAMLIKYMMESDPVEGANIMKGFLKGYFKKTFNNKYIGDIPENFAKVLGNISDAPVEERAAEGLINLYSDINNKLKASGISATEAADILNPLLYNPMDYVFGVGRIKKDVGNLTDVVLEVLLSKRANYADIPESLFATDTVKQMSKVIKGFSRGATIRNKYVVGVGEAFGNYLDTLDNIPMNASSFSEFVNKSMGYALHGTDDISRGMTVVDNVASIVINDAKKISEEFGETVTKILDEAMFKDGFVFSDKILAEKLPEAAKLIEKSGELGFEGRLALEKLIESVTDVKERGSRVLTDYLFDNLNRIDEMEVFGKKVIKKDLIKSIENQKNMAQKIADKLNSTENDAFIEEIVNMGRRDADVTQKGEKYVSKIVDMSDSDRVRYIEEFGLTEKQVEELKNLGGNAIDIDRILNRGGEISPKEVWDYTLNRILEGDMSFNYLVENSEGFRKIIQEGFENAEKASEAARAYDYYKVGNDGSFILKNEGERMSMLEKAAAHLSTLGNIMSKDKETQGILGRMAKTKASGYIVPSLDFEQLIGRKILTKTVPIENYASMVKQSLIKHGGKVVDSTMGEIVRHVFTNGKSALGELDDHGKVVLDILTNYKKDIDKFRKSMDLGDAWMFGDFFNFSNQGVLDKISNRVTGMWNYLPAEDIMRLDAKYGKRFAGDSGIYKNFMSDILFNARQDASDNLWARAAAKLNFATQKYVITKLYNITNLPKGLQQMESNFAHAEGIMRSMMGADTEAFNSIFELMQKNNKNFGFDLFDTEGVMGEGAMKLTNINLGEKARKIFGMNSLMLGDWATQKYAVKASLSQALTDIYKYGGESGIREFEGKLGNLFDWMKQQGFKERDFLNRHRYEKRFQDIILGKNPKEVKEMYSRFNSMRDFYHNEYAPFVGKARTAMGTFFVMDNIKELGSIRAIDKNRYMFGLMKWAMGKTGEYSFDVMQAFGKHPFTPKGLVNAFREPIFKRIFNEFAITAKMGRVRDRMANEDADWKSGVMATCVPLASLGMLFGESLYKNVVKRGIMKEGRETDALWQSMLKGVASFVNEMVGDRAFIYAGMLSKDLSKSYTTADASNDFAKVFLRTYLKQRWNNPFVKHGNISTQGYLTDAEEMYNLPTIIGGIIFNQQPEIRDQFNDNNSNIYNIIQGRESGISDYLPIIKNWGGTNADLGILYDSLNGYVKEQGIDGFIKKGTSKEQLFRLLSSFEENYVLQSDKYKDRSKTSTSDNILEKAVRSGSRGPDTQAFKTVIKGLAKEDYDGKNQVQVWNASLKDEERQVLKAEFDQMFEDIITNQGKGEWNTNDRFQKFVTATTRFGGSMTISGYMQAYANAYKSAVAKSLGLMSKEIAAGNKGDERENTPDIAIEDVGPSKFNDYLQYVTASRAMQTSLILDNRDIISGEKNITLALLNKYIEYDRENSPMGKYMTDITLGGNNFAKLWNIVKMNEIVEEQGQQGLVVPLAYQEQKAVDNFNQAISKAKDSNEMAEILKRFMTVQKDLAQYAGSLIQNPYTQALYKASLAAGAMRFADKLEEASPGALKQVMEEVGEDSFTNTLNLLTDSPAVTMADAFEISTQISAHPSSGGKGGSGMRIPKANVVKEHITKQLIPNYNRAAAIAARSSEGRQTSLPKFTNKYVQFKGGGIVPVKIPVAETSRVRSRQDEPRVDTKTAKLEVANLPVKEGRVLGGKYSVRAIKGSKAYSRHLK